MFKDSPEGQTHSWNDGCGEPAHNSMTNNEMCVCGHKKEKHDVAGSCQVMTESTINFCLCTSFRPAPKGTPEDHCSGCTERSWDLPEGRTHAMGKI